MGLRSVVVSLQSGLEEGEHGWNFGGLLTLPGDITMFALFEAGNQVVGLHPTPGCVAALLTWG